jgi:hypothetical protein
VEKILRLDLRATDFLPGKGYPTDLYWNSYDSEQTIHIDLPKESRLYEAVTNTFVVTQPSAQATLQKVKLAPKQAVQLVVVPGKGDLVYANNKTLVNGIAIDFNNGRLPLPGRVKRVRTDNSRQIVVEPARTDAEVDLEKSPAVVLNAGAGGTMKAAISFAWTSDKLWFRFKQVGPTTEMIEAPTLAELEKHFWDFECVALNFDAGREQMAVANVPEITLGWSSMTASNFAFSPDIAGFSVTTAGTAAANDREIIGSIPWQSLYKAIGMAQSLSDWVKPGMKFGVQPMIVDGSWKRQAYMNGKPYTRPTGFDRDSLTLVLKG